MVKISLVQNIKQSQKMTLTPQLLKAIKLLELNNIDLDDYLQQEILDNPLLEKAGDDESLKDNINDNDKNLSSQDKLEISFSHNEDLEGSPSFDTANLYESSSTSIDNIIEETLESKNSLYQIITDQINISFQNKIDRLIALSILGFIEPNGYLKVSTKELSIDLNIDLLRIEKILKVLKSFEPLGVFSNDLKEFLTLQLKSQNLLDSDLKLLLRNLTILANENIFSISRKLKIDKEKLIDSLDILKRCSPSPIDTDSDLISHINSPDIIVEKDKNEWIVSLNEETLPKVILLTGYWEELSRKKLSKEDKKYLSTNFLAGKGLVKALEQRASTILKVAKEIIKKQDKFLDDGIMGLRPLKLKDIAEELDIHESTVSRITNSKTIYTPRGTYDLKFFFSKSLNTLSNDDGLSSKVVKEKIIQLINNEEKILSDNKLSKLLKEEGINVARRTVAKYREEMTLPPSHQRKRLKQLAV
ncbi:MAG: RNA polymerase sigma-54 factor [Rhodobiaceae bacterium]|nr:RNA polymerase sigma-54 factor [Rhodobiaceae bacterium]